jgi:hypothetical protein
MPSLAEALSSQAPRHGGPYCQVCELIPSLNKEDVNALNEALDNARVTATMIVRALEEYGASISIATLRRHRRKECSTLRNVG